MVGFVPSLVLLEYTLTLLITGETQPVLPTPAAVCLGSLLSLSQVIGVLVTLCGAARHCLVHRCPGSASDPLWGS